MTERTEPTTKRRIASVNDVTGYNPYNPVVTPKGKEPITPKWRDAQNGKRQLYQTWIRMTKNVDDLYVMRNAAKKARRLDDLGQLTDAIYSQKQAIAHLRVISKHRFGKDIEELDAYK